MISHSIVTVCASSTGVYLAGPQDLKDLLGVTSTANDGVMANIMQDVTALFDEYVGYTLLQQTYLETVPSYGAQTLQVKTPISSVTSIKRGSATVLNTEYFVTDARVGLIFRETGWPNEAGIYEDLTAHIVPNSERPIYAIEYIGGYTFTTCSDGAYTLPRAIHRKATEMGATLWDMQGADRAVATKQVGDLRITYTEAKLGDPGGIPSDITQVLKDYRRHP